MFAVARNSHCVPGAVRFYSKEYEQRLTGDTTRPTIFETEAEAQETATRMAGNDRHGRDWFVVSFTTVSKRAEPVPPPVTVQRSTPTIVRDALGRFARKSEPTNAEQYLDKQF
jgi:hypothetical protein